MDDIPATEGHQSATREMLHDLEVEYVVKDISKEDAQELLNDLPEDYYVIDLYYDEVKRRLEFDIMLDDITPLQVTEHYDYMESNHPECKKRFEQLHDYRTAFDDGDTERYNAESIDLEAAQNRIIP